MLINSPRRINSIEYYKKEYAYSKQMKSNNNIAYAACDLAYMYAMEKKTDLLDQYAAEAKIAAERTGSFPAHRYVGGWLSEAYEITGNTKVALEFYKMYANAKDSINDRERIEKSSRAEAQSGFETKVEQLKKEEEKRKAIAEEKEQNQQVIRNILIAGFLIAMILLLIAYRSYVQKKKANVIISKQKQEVETQKVKIEEKNKEITDSINYAKFIQRSILPDPQEIMKAFPESFGLYKPKDVVSGDFYWFAKHGNISMIAAADCTGHGVPGALMSMLGNDKLHNAVNSNITDPGAMLSFVNEGVKTTLKQNEEHKSSQDGMDIALCCFDLSKNILRYAGANRPLWLIRSGKLTEFKPTKSAIGGSTDTHQRFEAHEIALEKGDAIYISTDGFADQFGGDKGKKMMTKNLKDLLLAIQHVPIKDQENILDEKLKQWQGGFEQVDDILLIGIRI